MAKIDFVDSFSFLLLEALLQKQCYLRELSEETGLAPSSVHKVMAKLLKQKMVLAEKQKNRKVFSLNYSSPLTTKLVGLIFVHKITRSRAFAKLVALKPRGLYLFGTAATGKVSPDSDIDLAIFFEKRPDSIKLSEIKRQLSNELKREIQLIVLTEDKIKSMRKENTELLNQIKGKSIVLLGESIE